MSRRLKYPLIIIIILIAAALTAAKPHSAENHYGNAIAENLAVVLLIDISGSMRYTDPEKLRETAALLLVDLLGPGDYLGVVTFDDNIDIVASLQLIGDSANRSEIKDRTAAALDPRGFTDYTAALLAAGKELEAVNRNTHRPVVFFLTDGEPNPDRLFRYDREYNEKYMQSMWEAVNCLTQKEVAVYSVAFSEDVDPAVIERISLMTRGDHYILDTPRDLLISFYSVLEKLKNRQRVTEESGFLQKTPTVVRFPVDGRPTQINLLIENLDGYDLDVILDPPPGVRIQDGNPSFSKGLGYCLYTLHPSGREAEGEWEAVISGNGRFRFLANADNPVKAWIVEPVYGVMHPFENPVEIKIMLTGIETVSEAVEVTAALKGPGWFRHDPVTLAGEGGYYSGSYTAVDRPGIYEIKVTVLMGGETVSTAYSKVHVKVLPSLSAEFSLKERYRCGEELMVEASLLLGGQRLAAGNELAVDHFSFVLAYDGGKRASISLYEGVDPEDAGLWSNRIEIQQEGKAEATLMAVGSYQGEAFLLEKTLGMITVSSPGEIFIEPVMTGLYSAPGRTLHVPLMVENRSSFKETLLIELQGNGPFRLPGGEIELEPGETKKHNIAILTDPSAAAGPAAVRFSFETADPFSVVIPGEIGMTFEILTPSRYLLRILSGGGALSAAILTILIMIVIVVLGGTVLNWIMVYPREKLEMLVYRKEEPGSEAEPGKGGVVLFHTRRTKAVISFNPESEADFIIPGSDFHYNLVFSLERLDRLPAFLKGWRFLLRRRMSVKKFVYTTPPGVIEAAGGVFTRRELTSGFRFSSGGFLFEYTERFGKIQEHQKNGVNVLEGKI